MSVTTLAIPRSPSHPAFGILPAARAGRLMRFNASSESPVPPPLRPEYYNRLAHDVLFDWNVACPVWGDVHDPNRIALFATLSGLPIGPEGPPTYPRSAPFSGDRIALIRHAASAMNGLLQN